MMRRLLPALCAWLCSAATLAQQPPAAPVREGYAYAYPRILAQQRLFGLAHGVALLAGACRALPGDAAAATEGAYALWRVRQEPAIETARGDLSEYYFGNGEARPDALVAAMSLKTELDLPAPELEAACASLPEALQQPRYDLGERFRLEELMAQAVAAVEIEARERHCRELFAGDSLAVHEARYALWQEINAPVLEQGNKALADAWPTDGPAASFADWYTELRRKTLAGGGLAQCADFSESLKRPETALHSVFRRPPPLQSPAAPQ